MIDPRPRRSHQGRGVGQSEFVMEVEVRFQTAQGTENPNPDRPIGTRIKRLRFSTCRIPPFPIEDADYDG